MLVSIYYILFVSEKKLMKYIYMCIKNGKNK